MATNRLAGALLLMAVLAVCVSCGDRPPGSDESSLPPRVADPLAAAVLPDSNTIILPADRRIPFVAVDWDSPAEMALICWERDLRTETNVAGVTLVNGRGRCLLTVDTPALVPADFYVGLRMRAAVGTEHTITMVSAFGYLSEPEWTALKSILAVDSRTDAAISALALYDCRKRLMRQRMMLD